MRPTLILLSLSLLGAGCDSGGSATGFWEADTGSANGVDDAETYDTAQDTGIFVAPQWWRLSAGLILSEGVPIAEKSTLSLELIGSKDEQLCFQEFTVKAVESLEPTHESIVTWWRLTPTPLDTLCGIYDTPLSESILIGVGVMHPDILAAISSISTISADAPLNAAYAAVDDTEQIYVYGVAGTPASYEGEGEVAIEAPLEDGIWQLEPVYRFSY